MRAAIILAAGASRRFGPRDKLNTRLSGKTLLDHAVANARASGVRRIVLVSARPRRVPGVKLVRACRANRGLSVSLAAGLAALRPIEREALIFLADMPYARAPRMTLRAGSVAIRPRFSGQPGHPMLVRVNDARAALTAGDSGLGRRLKADFVRADPGHILDIDTPMMLRRARRHGSCALGRRCSPA